MVRTRKEKVISFLLAMIILLGSFLSDVSLAFAKEAEIPKYALLIAESEHGSVAVQDGVEQAEPGRIVQLSVSPEEGYRLEELLINEGSTSVEAVPDVELVFQFVMPAEDVVISAVFVQEDPIEEPPVPSEEEEKDQITDSVTESADEVAPELPKSEEENEPPVEEIQAEPEKDESVITGVYFEDQTEEEILDLAEQGMDLQEFFQYSIWGFLGIEDIRYLVENNYTLDDLYAVIEGEASYYNSELQNIAEKYYSSQNHMPAGISAFSARDISGSTATAAISGSVSNAALGEISAFGPGNHGNMLRITLDGTSAFCAQYGASCRTGMTYTKVSGDEIGIDRSQQYLIYRIIGWYYEAQQIHDNTGNYAITQAAIWLVRNGQWDTAENMAAAIRPMLTKVSVLDDATSISLFQAMADWVNGGNAQPRVGIDFWYNGPNQFLVTVGGNTYIETEDPEYSAYVKLEKTDSITGAGIEGKAEFKIFTEDGSDTGAEFSKAGNTYTSSVLIKDEDHDTFYVQEVSAPSGYLLNDEKYYFTIEDGDEEAEKVITTNGSSFENAPYWVQIVIPKTDSETGEKIENGAEFTVTAETGNLSEAVSFEKQSDGSYLSSKIYYNESNQGKFYVQETKAPANYYGDWENESAEKAAGSNDNKVKYPFSVDESTHGQTIRILNEGATFANERVKGNIQVNKIDVEAGNYLNDDTAHGDAVLDGAVYGLYARDDILYPDGVSGTVYPAGTLVAEGTIQSGSLSWDDLYLGSYYVKEIAAPEGYLPDEKEYDVTLTYQDESVEIVVGKSVVDEQVKKRAFQLQKLDGESLDEQYELAGAGFEVYLLSELGIETADKSDEALIQEVTEKYPDYKNGLDDSARAKLYENDSSEITAYNESQAAAGGSGLTQIGTNRYQLNEIFTDVSGRLVSPELPYGTYVVVETTVPKNTLIDIKPFIVRIEEDSREALYQRYFLDKDFTAKIKIVKIDADTGKTVLKAGTSYRIYDLDHEEYVQLPIVVDNKEEIKEVFTTNEDGYILTDAALPCGRYRIEEVQAADGFYNEAVGTESTLGMVEFEINTDQTYETSEISGDAIIEFTYSNRETRGELTIEKRGEQLAEAKNVSGGIPILSSIAEWLGADEKDVKFIYEELPVAGAEYTIEAAEDIYTQDNQKDENGNRTVWFREGETVAVLVTGEEGQIDDVKYPAGGYAEHPIVQVIHDGETGRVAVRLPLGSYRVYESKAPYGYLGTDEVKQITFTWENQKEELVFNSTPDTDGEGPAVFENERVKAIPEENFTDTGVGIYKNDQDTDVPVAGTVFGLYTTNDIFNWKGELVVPADTLLGTAETDESGFAHFNVDIPYMSENYEENGGNSGDYYIVEHAVPGGFFLDQTPLSVHFEYQDEHTPFIVVQAKQKNISTSADILKTDLETQLPLPGALLQIVEKSTGEIVAEFETTDTAYNIRGLKLSTEKEENIYILREKQPADGYVTAEDIEFKLIQAKDEEGKLLEKADVYVLKTVEEEQEENKGVSLLALLRLDNRKEQAWAKVPDATVVMEDDFTRIDISKVDISGEELPGAHLVLKDQDGNIIDEWDSTEEPHRIERIKPGEYTLTETLIPDGYAQAETVTFTVQETGEVQKIEMTDDYTRVEVEKVDALTGQPLKGAKLAILNEKGEELYSWVSDGSVYSIEKIPHGSYILIEKEAPKSYQKAESISFEVSGESGKHHLVMEDELSSGHIEIYKTGDVLTGYTTHDSDFGTIYRMEFEKDNLSGVEFTVYDESGSEVDIIRTDEKGYGISKELPVGKYTVKETKTPSGLAANYNEYQAEITYEKGKGIINAMLDVENEVLDTEINVYKVGEMIQPEDGTFGYGSKPLEGVYFGIYTGEDMKASDGHTVLSADQLIGVIKTNKEGKATLKSALVSGRYYYKELQTLPGYVLDDTEHTFELKLGNEPTTVFEVNKENPMLNAAKKNEVLLIKVDAADTSRRLQGVEFELYTENGEKLGTYITDANGEISISNLAYGKYYFKETRSLDGYQKILGKIHFEIGDERIMITCRNTTIPKLGFEDSYLNFAVGGVLLASAGFLTFIIVRAKRRKLK